MRTLDELPEDSKLSSKWKKSRSKHKYKIQTKYNFCRSLNEWCDLSKTHTLEEAIWCFEKNCRSFTFGDYRIIEIETGTIIKERIHG